MNTVQEKTAIVTGGANGIGFQCCRELLRNGAKTVAIFDLPNSNGELSATKLNEEFGTGRALFFPSDVTKYEEFEGVFKNAVKSLRGLDILINNAGVFHDTAWLRTIETNFTAVVKSTLLGYDYMGKHKGGKGGIIMNVSSTAAIFGLPFCPIYAATKNAVLGFTVILKDHFEKTGVSVRVICPGATDTPILTGTTKKFLDFVDEAEAKKNVQTWIRQPPENVAKAMIEVIEKGANGTVWISKANKPPYEIELGKYKSIK